MWLGMICGLVAIILPALPGIPDVFIFVSEASLALSGIVNILSTTIVTKLVLVEYHGEVLSIMSSTMGVSNAVGPLVFSALSGMFLETEYPGSVFLIFAVVSLIGFLLSLALPSDDILD